ncbi:hypothetical protein [Streptomyces alboflavus]|uniref:hypothetical protein n=1 Tax=Streptomyces alboflavus TaxID=67267 RepID=UPI00368EA7E5
MSTTSEDLNVMAQRAETRRKALAVLLDAVDGDRLLAAALARLDVSDMGGVLDRAGLDAARAEAEADAANYAALAETQRRAEAAGVIRAHRCVCGHSGINHAYRLTEDERLPCSLAECRCGDLDFAPVRP